MLIADFYVTRRLSRMWFTSYSVSSIFKIQFEPKNLRPIPLKINKLYMDYKRHERTIKQLL